MKALIGALIMLCNATAAHAAGSNDPDWPCNQRKVPHLSVGQMWSGPLITEGDLKDWRKEEAAAALAPVLAVRRTSEEEAGTLVEQFAENADDARAEKLRLLFAGVFALIDHERSEIIGGIARYARTQAALADAIDRAQAKLAALNKAAEPNLDVIEELEDKILWDTRIYKDRAQSLEYVCETPVILERRAFAIAREIMARMK